MGYIEQPGATLEWITPDAELVIERAGRTCYKSEDKITPDSAGAFIRKILASGHESVIEHASASFRFICDRGVTHELVRHRLVAYSQESTRYCNYGKAGQIKVIVPPEIKESKTGYPIWEKAMQNAEDAYLILINNGFSPQIARSVLPTCLKTEIVTTCNLREWRHILRLRMSPKAHPQIREIMEPVLQILKRECPNVFHDFI
jgi:thymidylate synthase (FAD)